MPVSAERATSITYLDGVHARRTIFFFLATLAPFVERVLTRNNHLANALPLPGTAVKREG